MGRNTAIKVERNIGRKMEAFTENNHYVNMDVNDLWDFLDEAPLDIFGSLCEMIGLTYDEQNFLKFYTYDEDADIPWHVVDLSIKIMVTLKRDNLTQWDIRKIHYMFQHLTIWDYNIDAADEMLLDFEDLIRDAVSYAKDRNIDMVRNNLRAAYDTLQKIRDVLDVL